jgi:hypothetical protein
MQLLITSIVGEVFRLMFLRQAQIKAEQKQ